MYVILWEFEVRAERAGEFELAYGPSGAWARLFAKGDGFLGTELLHDHEARCRYVTIDRWASRAAFEAFGERYREQYAELDARCEALTERETLIGRFGT